MKTAIVTFPAIMNKKGKNFGIFVVSAIVNDKKHYLPPYFVCGR